VTTLRNNLEQNLGRIILVLLLIGCVVVLRPFISALLWGSILSFSIWPIYRRLESSLGGRSTLAAVIVAVGMIGVVLMPLLVVGITLGDNVKELTTATQRWVAQGPPAPPAWDKIPGSANPLKNHGKTWKRTARNSPRKLNALSNRSPHGCSRRTAARERFGPTGIEVLVISCCCNG
jgi:predicted PurR-regulated permease PerM